VRPAPDVPIQISMDDLIYYFTTLLAGFAIGVLFTIAIIYIEVFK